MTGWTHDHSSRGVPSRPHGYSGLVATFGPRCTAAASGARSYWPHGAAVNVGKYAYYHTYLARNIGYNLRNHVEASHKNGALYPLIGSYNCRQIEGSTKWSVHAWGAAMDTNSQLNPRFQTYWNGRGADGKDHGKYLPNLWKGPSPGHGFYWGLNFSPGYEDPMHFQYVTGY